MMTKAPAGPTVGMRIREAREDKQMTQQEVAKLLGISRAAVAQWESDTTSPSIHTAMEVAKILDTPSSWIVLGIRQKPLDTSTVPEVMFGTKPTETQTIHTWTVPNDYLRSELHAPADGLIIWRVEGTNMAPLYEYGDKVIIDTNAKKPSPSGVFLIWDGMGPTLHQIQVVPGVGIGGKVGGPVARISSTGGGDSYEVPAEKLVVIGRVRGLLKHV